MRSFHENMLANLVLIPGTIASSTVPAAYISMADYERVVFLIFVGDMPTSSTLDAKVVQATDAAGTGSKDITGAAITQLGATDDDKMVSIEVRDTALDVEGGFTHISLTLVEAADPIGCVLAFSYKGGGLPPTQPAEYEEQVEVS